MTLRAQSPQIEASGMGVRSRLLWNHRRGTDSSRLPHRHPGHLPRGAGALQHGTYRRSVLHGGRASSPGTMVDIPPSLAGCPLAVRCRRRRRLPHLTLANPCLLDAHLDGEGAERHTAGAELRGPSLIISAPSVEASGGNTMAWNTPTVVEICAGFEVTAYAVAEM